MKTIEFIKEKGLDALNTELGISVKKYDEGLIVLNYNQIESPKAHPVVMECRGLILDTEYNIVSRSFDRFFNLGEQPETQLHLDWNKAVCFEKVDGSLIKIYNWNSTWYISTRGTAFAESGVNGFPIAFKELVLKALECNEEQFQARCNLLLDPSNTYICEVTAMENRVVTRYEGYSLWFLAARKNQTGEFVEKGLVSGVGIKDIKSFKFDSVENCINTAKNLKDLNEGYVIYQDGIPVCKVKSPAYCAVHLLRGEGLSPKRIMNLVLINEVDEYLKYFPEDEKYFTTYTVALRKLLLEIYQTYSKFEDIVDQKEYAIKVKGFAYSAVLFQARSKGGNTTHIFHNQTESYKMKLLEQFINA